MSNRAGRHPVCGGTVHSCSWQCCPREPGARFASTAFGQLQLMGLRRDPRMPLSARGCQTALGYPVGRGAASRAQGGLHTICGQAPKAVGSAWHIRSSPSAATAIGPNGPSNGRQGSLLTYSRCFPRTALQGRQNERSSPTLPIARAELQRPVSRCTLHTRTERVLWHLCRGWRRCRRYPTLSCPSNA